MAERIWQRAISVLDERFIHLTSPLLVLMLGTVVLLAAHLLRGTPFLQKVGQGVCLTGLGLGIQSLLDNRALTLIAPFTSLIYLAGAALIVMAVASRAGEGRGRRYFCWAVIGGCFLNALIFSYALPDLRLRMQVLNVALTLIYLSQFPYFWPRRKSLAVWDQILGYSLLLLALYHQLRLAYVELFQLRFTGAEAAFFENLTLSSEWKFLLFSSNVISLWFVALSLFCAIYDRISALRADRNIDPLTGLLNRRGFYEAATAEIEAHPGLKWSIATGDIDNFKRINDSFGHSAGDRALVFVADSLRRQIGPHEVVSRFGGEEFVLLLGGESFLQNFENIDARRERIGLSLLPEGQGRVTMSFGLAEIGAEGMIERRIHEALLAADRALYMAKEQGRNRLVDAPRQWATA